MTVQSQAPADGVFFIRGEAKKLANRLTEEARRRGSDAEWSIRQVYDSQGCGHKQYNPKDGCCYEEWGEGKMCFYRSPPIGWAVGLSNRWVGEDGKLDEEHELLEEVRKTVGKKEKKMREDKIMKVVMALDFMDEGGWDYPGGLEDFKKSQDMLMLLLSRLTREENEEAARRANENRSERMRQRREARQIY